MRTHPLTIADIVAVRIRRTVIVERVTEIANRIAYLEPICPGAGRRHAKAREIVTHRRTAARRSGGGTGDQTDRATPMTGRLSASGGAE